MGGAKLCMGANHLRWLHFLALSVISFSDERMGWQVGIGKRNTTRQDVLLWENNQLPAGNRNSVRKIR